MKVFHKNIKYPAAYGGEYILVFETFDVEIKYIPKAYSTLRLAKLDFRMREDYFYANDYSEYDEAIIKIRLKDIVRLIFESQVLP